VSGNYFALLGVGAQLGRVVTPDDDTDSKSAVAAISYGYWQKRFGRSPAAIGRSIAINNVQVTVVGVLPRDFTDIQSLTTPPRDIYIPLALDARLGVIGGGAQSNSRLKEGANWWLQLVGRLKPGVTFGQVRGNLEGAFEDAARRGWESQLALVPPNFRPLLVRAFDNHKRTAVPHLEIDSARRGIYDAGTDDVKSARILGAVVALIMVIVCANVANLLLSRGAARQREISVRMSLGATRLRVVRQLLTESLLLSSAGGVLGVLLGYWARQLLPFASEAPMDWRVLTFTGVLSVVAAVAFGLAPALRATRLDLSGRMKESGRSVTRPRTLLTRALVVLQVGISLAVLIGAGLLLRTVRNLRQAPSGFDTRNLIIFSVNPARAGYDEKQAGRLFDDLQARLSAIPGVRAVSHSFPDLLAKQIVVTNMHLQAGTDHKVWDLQASPEYMSAMGFRLIRGRGIEGRDTLPNASSVSLINETAAKTFFPGEDPIGQRWGRSPQGETEIVGIFGDVKYEGLRDPAPPTVLEPFPHDTPFSASFEVRTADNLAGYMKAVREAVQSVAPNLPIVRMLTQSDFAEQGIEQERFFSLAFSLFGALALLLASIGLFGVMSYSVASRTNEIGIRMSLGAQKHEVVRMVLSESLWMIAGGVAAGLGAALAAGRLIRSMLFGLAPTDAVTIAVAVLTLSVVAVFAGYLPARRAARIDPMVALRYE
jgi:predicted permease